MKVMGPRRLVDDVQAVAIDLDGTLVDSAPDLAATTNAMLEHLEAQPLPEARVAALVGDGIDVLVERALVESIGRAPEAPLLAVAAPLFRSLYSQRLFERGRIYPGVIEGLAAMRDAGLVLFCVTNKESRFTRDLLGEAGLMGEFAAVFCADRPEQRKPAPALLRRAAGWLDATPAEVLAVGDSRHDVLAARGAGSPVVLVDYGYNQGRPALAERPDGVIGRLEAVVTLPAIDRARAASGDG